MVPRELLFKMYQVLASKASGEGSSSPAGDDTSERYPENPIPLIKGYALNYRGLNIMI